MTIQEALRQSGFTQEQIDALDAKSLNNFGTMLTTAENDKKAAADAVTKANADFAAAKEAVAKAEKERADATAEREKAELQYRSNVEFYDTKVVPGLTGWDEEKLKLENARVKAEAEAAFYRTQAEAAKTGGFIPTDAPGYVPPQNDPKRDGTGRYVTGADGGTPGSPTYMDPVKLAAQFSDKAATLSNIEWKYRKLYNDVMPIAPSQLIAEADAQKLSPDAYAEKRFGFVARETELNATRQREHEAKIASDSAAARDAEWKTKFEAREAEVAADKKKMAESGGNNPDVRLPSGSAKYAEIKRAVEVGERPNPLKMTDAQRRAATRQAIHSEIQEREGAVA